MTIPELLKILEAMGACPSSREWVGGKSSPCAAWRAADPEWMRWLLIGINSVFHRDWGTFRVMDHRYSFAFSDGDRRAIVLEFYPYKRVKTALLAQYGHLLATPAVGDGGGST